MSLTNQTRPSGGRVGCEMLGRPSHSTLTPIDLRSQLFASRFGLKPWLAQDYAWLCYGEGCND